MKYVFSLLLTLQVSFCACGRSEDSETGAFWGAETNSFQGGLLIRRLPLSSGKEFELFPMVTLAGTNAARIWIPPEPQRYRMSLHDEKGNAVKPTDRGKKLGAKLKLKQDVRKGHGYIIATIIPQETCGAFPAFALKDFSQVDHLGPYTLTCELRFLRPNPRRGVSAIVLPAVKLPIQITLNTAS